MCKGRWGRWHIELEGGGKGRIAAVAVKSHLSQAVPLESSHGSEKVGRRRGIRNDTQMRRWKAK